MLNTWRSFNSTRTRSVSRIRRPSARFGCELELKVCNETICHFPSASPRRNIAAGKRSAGDAVSLDDSVVEELSNGLFGGSRMDGTSATRHRFSRQAAATRNTAPEAGKDVSGAYKLSHLRALEAQSIYILREVAAEFERPALLFSGGKDSIVMLHLARKAFFPSRPPFPVAARRHGPKLPRSPRIPRPHGANARPPPRGRQGAGRHRRRTHLRRRWALEQLATSCRRPRCCGRSARTNSTPSSEVPVATRRRHAPKSGSTASATSSVSGTRRTSVRSCGTCSTGVTTRASTSGSFRSRIGRNSTSGSTSPTSGSTCPPSTSPTSAWSSCGTAC